MGESTAVVSCYSTWTRNGNVHARTEYDGGADLNNREYALVTGGGGGIGRGVAFALAARGLEVWVVGRRAAPLEETCRAGHGRIHPVVADVSTEAGRAAVIVALPDSGRLRALVHNAGVLEPVAPIERLTPAAWRHNQAVNVEGPLFLTRALLPRLTGGRVLHVSSGAAHQPRTGWAAYCTAKAGLHMLYRCLNEELADRGLLCGSVRPGVVDTEMQTLIRGQGSEDFPDVERFREMHRQGQLHRPEEVGAFVAWLLLDCDDRAYPCQEWDLEDSSHWEHWKPAE